jgi:PncC family amidohydrolase
MMRLIKGTAAAAHHSVNQHSLAWEWLWEYNTGDQNQCVPQEGKSDTVEVSLMTQVLELALEEKIGKLLVEQGLTLALAESCTGGLIGHRITNVPGSSKYFMGGVVAYAYDTKERVLGVRHDTLYDYGAVSEQTAIEMARGARRLLTTDVALAVTGIAGPGGGMPEKPVGLVYIALSARDFERCERYVWPHSRVGNKVASAEAALTMLWQYLEGQTA